MTGPDPGNRWVIVAHWRDTINTQHGPFRYAMHADDWARKVLGADERCTSWDIEPILPAVRAAA